MNRLPHSSSTAGPVNPAGKLAATAFGARAGDKPIRNTQAAIRTYVLNKVLIKISLCCRLDESRQGVDEAGRPGYPCCLRKRKTSGETTIHAVAGGPANGEPRRVGGNHPSAEGLGPRRFGGPGSPDASRLRATAPHGAQLHAERTPRAHPAADGARKRGVSASGRWARSGLDGSSALLCGVRPGHATDSGRCREVTCGSQTGRAS